MEYAGFWMRAIAYLIDTVIVQVVVQAINVAIIVGMLSGGAEEAGLIISSVLGTVLALLYWAVLESSGWQATVGKRIVGIRVTDLAGNRISFGRALGRTLAKFLSSIILMIGYIMAAFTERKQGLHDLIAGTLVVYK